MAIRIQQLRALPLFLLLALYACGQSKPHAESSAQPANSNSKAVKSMKTDTAIFGAGCFWCVEAIFQEVKGVQKVESGFSGGNVKNPSYKLVCTGTTGHAEVARITYDPSIVIYEQLLEVFFKVHDPTTLNRQGADEGTQYRSAVFYTNEHQKAVAERAKQLLNASGAYASPIVTEIAPFTEFFKAEDYHQNYYNQNGEQPYCKFVIRPKVEKFEKVFKELLAK